MLACRVVCCSHRSNRRIRVCISHQSDCRIRVCTSHQSYHSIRISCINYSVWVLFSCKWCHGIRGLCTKMTVTSTRQTTYIPSPTTKTMSKVQSEHTQSLHYMNIKQFFNVLELCSTNQIPFCHIRLRSITCHFLNNPHFITYSNRFTQHHWKKFTWNFMLLIVSFPCILLRLTFSMNKIRFQLPWN